MVEQTAGSDPAPLSGVIPRWLPTSIVAFTLIESVASRTRGFVPVARSLPPNVIVLPASTHRPVPPLTTFVAHIGELPVSMVPEYVCGPVGAAAKQIEIGAVP
jgi:hypothetical protein